jgi:hypothetical protein
LDGIRVGRHLAAALCAAFACGAASAAAAQAGPTRPGDDRPAAEAALLPFPIRLEPALLVGYAAEGGGAAGGALSGFALAGPIELGASGTIEMQPFGYSRRGLAAHAGLRARLHLLELDVAGTLGTAETEWSGPLLSDDPNPTGATSFVGGRAGIVGLVFLSKRKQVRLGIGAVTSFEYDLDRYERRDQRFGTERGSLRGVFMLGLD